MQPLPPGQLSGATACQQHTGLSQELPEEEEEEESALTERAGGARTSGVVHCSGGIEDGSSSVSCAVGVKPAPSSDREEQLNLCESPAAGTALPIRRTIFRGTKADVPAAQQFALAVDYTSRHSTGATRCTYKKGSEPKTQKSRYSPERYSGILQGIPKTLPSLAIHSLFFKTKTTHVRRVAWGLVGRKSSPASVCQ